MIKQESCKSVSTTLKKRNSQTYHSHRDLSTTWHSLSRPFLFLKNRRHTVNHHAQCTMHNAPCTMVPFDNLSRLTVVKSFTSLIQFYHRLFSKISTQTAVMNSQVLLFHSSSIFVNLHLWLKCVELFRCYTCLWTQHNSFSTEQWCCLQTIEETLLQWLVIKQKKKNKQEKVLLAVSYEAVKQFQLDLAILSPEH